MEANFKAKGPPSQYSYLKQHNLTMARLKLFITAISTYITASKPTLELFLLSIYPNDSLPTIPECKPSFEDLPASVPNKQRALRVGTSAETNKNAKLSNVCRSI